MTGSAAARLAKVLLVILAVWMPVSTFAAAATPGPASEIEAPCGEPLSPHDAAEAQAEENEALHAPSSEARHALPGAPGLGPDGPALRPGERRKPPHQPPKPASPR